ncbi:S9 family peptidase [Pseudactinotalea suaedae]|uniref:S9 family peptidase n=1 Tax=Pseudactinotalea suaedae TaxID=1524924 RepID=UPI0012E29CD7|nr:S9 family peptidase [Pseudactinotalea suaedae]
MTSTKPATETTLIPRDALFGNPERASVQISPDGRHLSWLAPVEGVLNVWVAPADDLGAARPVTRDTARGIRAYFWTYRPDVLLYLRDTGGDEDFHAFRVDVTGGEPLDLTPYEATTADIAGVSPQVPDAVLIGMNDRDPELHDLYRVDLATGERILVEQNTDGFLGYLADDRYEVRYALKQRPDAGMDLLARTEEGWEIAESIGFEDSLSTAPLSLTADGSVLYMLDSRERETAALVALDVATGSRSVVHSDPRADVQGRLLVHPTTGVVQAVGVTYLEPEWAVIDETVAADLERLRELGPGDAVVNTRTLDDATWVIAYSAPDTPLAYHLYHRESGEIEYLFSGRPALEGAPLVPMTGVEIVARDGMTLPSYLTLPAGVTLGEAGRAGTAVPMVLFVHGGPWARDGFTYDPWAQWLANRGYAVLQVNFRGSTGFGKAFTNAGDQQWAAAMHEDLLDAVEWAVQQGVTTSDKVAIMGGSYGGYATLAGLTFTPTTFACGVDIVGPSNLHTLLETIPPYWKPMFEQLARRVGDPRTEEGRALLTERSPLGRAEAIVRPLLIGQGANDPRVKQAESDQIVTAMSERGIPVTYVLFPDEGHGFHRPENSKAFNAVAENFLATHLGGRAEPIDADLRGSSTEVPTGADGVPGLVEALSAHEAVSRA